MNIDFNKLLNMLLPTFLRSGLTELITAIAGQFTSLYADFQTWQTDIRLQAAMTCQTMYLEAILNYRLLGSFDRVIYITDGDGIAVDFIVNIPQNVIVDSYRLSSLVDKYKSFGKRYRIDQTAYSYESLWSDFVCAQIEETYSAVWSGFVCAQQYSETSYLYMGTNPSPTLPSYSAARGYYTNPGGASMNNTIYTDSALTIPLTGYANNYIAISRNGTDTPLWVQIDTAGKIIAVGTF